MDRAHLADLRWMSPRALYPRLQLFSTFCPPGSPLDVADPFGLSEDDYERALDQIEVGCHGLLSWRCCRKQRWRRSTDHLAGARASRPALLFVGRAALK